MKLCWVTHTHTPKFSIAQTNTGQCYMLLWSRVKLYSSVYLLRCLTGISLLFLVAASLDQLRSHGHGDPLRLYFAK